ncbi:MAG TPA: hypothetical protein VFI65_12850 [Streptosporangiaceae bacterium]|nr:hypothetical protein [Streptosporangiaceae bacterium]
MTLLVLLGLLTLAFLDAAFACFRSSAGRTGLIDHRAADFRAAGRGIALLSLLLILPVALALADIATHHFVLTLFTRAGIAMLMIYGPFGLLSLAALACYLTLGWRQRYVACAVILAPLTLMRPVVAILGGVLAALSARQAVVTVCTVLSVAAVLTIEPFADRYWFGRRADRGWPRPSPQAH